MTLDRPTWAEYRKLTRARGLSASVTIRDFVKREVVRMRRETARAQG